MAPAYGPRRVVSNSSTISIARTFGAPLTVPCGKVALNTSTAPTPSLSRPDTPETMCMTCEYRSITISSSTPTVP